MSIELDGVRRVGSVTVAALVEQSVRSGRLGAIGVHAAKHPVAVLIRRDGVTQAFDLNGQEIASDEFERRFPGRRAALEVMAGADKPSA